MHRRWRMTLLQSFMSNERELRDYKLQRPTLKAIDGEAKTNTFGLLGTTSRGGCPVGTNQAAGDDVC
ncbi:hypothetical protein J6590_030288 [Homalodisca vitripennis]|nr:hypothetical protein J6590_030288 [Homalodisca vitripennis]